jgi:gliding motility-associated lipoprotein GldD
VKTMKRWPELILLLIIMLLGSCGSGEDDFMPKPRGYFRIELPPRDYQSLDIDCPYTFEYNSSAQWQKNRRACWGDVYYPDLKGRLQLTYKQANADNLETLLEEGRKLAYEHTVKAAGIEEKVFDDPDAEVYGIFYNIQGEAATNIQFFMTDSANHFLRGVMYFYAEPNVDSLRPVNDYMKGEIVHLIETLQWKNSSQ